MLLRILSVASVILGLYLIISFFFMRKPVEIKQPTIYHLGCYDSNNIINHSEQLTQRISKIQDIFQKSTKLNIYNSKVFTENFDKDIHDVAKTFQIYLYEYYKTRGVSRQLLNYQNSLKTAKYQLNTCKKSIDFDSNKCVNSWKQLSSTQTQLETLKVKITQLMEKKKKKQEQISLTIFPKYPKPGQDEIQKKYRTKIQQIQQNIQNDDNKLIQYRTTRNKIKIQIGDIDNRLIQLKSILYQCLNNQQLIIYCIKITQEIHQIKQSAPKLDKVLMQKKLTKKLFIITTIQNNLKKARRANDQKEVKKLEIELQQQKDQFRLLQSRVINFQTKQQSICAMCSQERILQLKRNISGLQSRKAAAGIKIIDIQSNIQSIQLQLTLYKTKLDQIFQQKQKEITSQLCLDDQCKINKQRYIAQAQIQLNQVKKSIIDKKVQFNGLKVTYENRLYHVKSYLTGIDSIADCIRKREYYEELKKKRPKQVKIDYNMIDLQKSMVKQLNDFEL